MDIKNILVSAASAVVASAVTVPVMVSFVTLQSTSPGTPELGNSNITGNSISGRFGAGTTPTNARIQVNETGLLQGVRASTTTTDAINALTSATTGGTVTARFLNSSASGKAVLAENISTTGSAIGGDFKARSTTGGAAIVGRQIATTGPGIGVSGTSASPGGVAGFFNNTGSNNGAQVGTGTDSILTKGALPRHGYVSNSPSAMVPVAYGYVFSDGIVNSGSGNFTVTKVGTGKYEIDVAGFTANLSEFAISAIATESTGDQYCSMVFPTTGEMRINVFDQSDNNYKDSDFSFIAYRRQGFAAGPQLPDELGKPAQLRQYGDTEAWAKADSKSFKRWVERRKAWERAQEADSPKNP